MYPSFNIKYQTQKYLFKGLFLFWIFSSCHAPSKLKVDVSKIKVKIEFKRFEKDLFDLDSLHGNLGYQKLANSYPEFFPLFINKVASLGNYPLDYKTDLNNFIKNKDLRKLKKDCDSVYPNLNAFTPGLEDGFRHFLYYYPNHKLPNFITFISGFNSAIVNTDSSLAIGLDMFLGSKYPIYRSVQFPQYISRTLTYQYIPVIALKGYGKQLFAEKKGSTKLLDEMIYEGKILYFLDALFPKLSDTLKISYTGNQLEWCKNHESEIWGTLLENDRLFKGDKNDLDTYFAEGPFTSGFNAQSAPRLGEWMGWQIIKKYMESSKLSLPGLMKENDSEKILRVSGYRP